jgi:hypothetical protein
MWVDASDRLKLGAGQIGDPMPHFFISQPERPKPVGGYHCPRDVGLVPKGEIPHEHGR